jgi:hypothetical protein
MFGCSSKWLSFQRKTQEKLAVLPPLPADVPGPHPRRPRVLKSKLHYTSLARTPPNPPRIGVLVKFAFPQGLRLIAEWPMIGAWT